MNSKPTQPNPKSLEEFDNFLKVLKEKGDEEALKLLKDLPLHEPKKVETMNNEELLATVKSGDIILWSGSSAISKIIRKLAGNPFSHASIVFKGALDGKEKGTDLERVPRIFQSTWSSFDEVRDGKKYGVSRQTMLNELHQVLTENEAEGEPGSLRILNCKPEVRKELHKKLARFILETDGDSYPGANEGAPDFGSYLKGLKGIAVKHPHHYTCAELVAAALQYMEVLDKKKPMNAYSPSELSDDHNDDFVTHLKNGLTYRTEIFCSP